MPVTQYKGGEGSEFLCIRAKKLEPEIRQRISFERKQELIEWSRETGWSLSEAVRFLYFAYRHLLPPSVPDKWVVHFVLNGMPDAIIFWAFDQQDKRRAH